METDLNTKFINKSKLVHGDRYDYSKVEYKRNSINVIIICKLHGEFLQRPNNHLNGAGCKECSKQNRALTNLERYGHVNIAHGTKKLKIEQTNLVRYGFNHPSKNKDIVMKGNDTRLKKHGHKNPAHGIDAKAKIRKTMFDKYGVENASQSTTIQQKRQLTFLTKYGFPHTFAVPTIVDKIHQQCLTKYGVKYPFQSNDIQQKIKNTHITKYQGYYKQHHLTTVLPILQNRTWLEEQYTNQLRTMSSIADELNTHTSTIHHYLIKHDIPRRQATFCSYLCIQWLEGVVEQEGINIQHALNGGEYKIPGTRYTADGYCAETNTIYEFHGDIWHGNLKIFQPDDICHPYSSLTASELYQNTIERESELRSMGYNLVVMWEGEYTKRY